MGKKFIHCNKLIIFLFLAFYSLSYGGEIIDRVLAIVEKEIILLSEVEMMTRMYAIELGIDPRVEPEKYEQLKKESFDQLIDQYVLLAKAIEDSVEITEEEVDMVLDQNIENLKAQFGSEEEMNEKLGMPIRKLKEMYREDVKKKGLVDKYRQIIMEGIRIRGEELQEFYDIMKDSLPEVPAQYEISQIVKSGLPGANARESALEKAQGILLKLKSGEDFSELAKQYSEDEGTAANGGEIGFINKGDLIGSFEEVAFNLNPGEISNVVETPLGYHIIEVSEKKDDMVKVAHILIKITQSKEDEENIADFLRELKKRVENGESFEELAKEYSDNPDDKETGGKLGWIFLDAIQPELEAFKQIIPYLKKGEISEPFETPYGYHIIRLENKIEKHEMTLEQDRDYIEQIAKTRKANEEFIKFVESAKKEVYIEIKEEL